MLLVHGEASGILLQAAVVRMRTDRPYIRVVSLPGVGHGLVLTETPAITAILAFLEDNV